MAEVYTESWVEGDNTMQDLKTSTGRKLAEKKNPLNMTKHNSFSALGIVELKIKITGVFLPYFK